MKQIKVVTMVEKIFKQIHNKETGETTVKILKNFEIWKMLRVGEEEMSFKNVDGLQISNTSALIQPSFTSKFSKNF